MTGSTPQEDAESLRLDTFLPYRLSVVSNLVSGVIAGSYAGTNGLTTPAWRVLAVLAETPGMTQREVGARTRMEKVAVSRAAAALEARGLVERRAHPDDGRARVLRLTSAGRRRYAGIAPAAKALSKEIFSGLSKEERDRLFAALATIEGRALTLADPAEEPA